jgi:hypothetical protein
MRLLLIAIADIIRFGNYYIINSFLTAIIPINYSHFYSQ